MSCLCRVTAGPSLQPPAHPFPSTWPRASLCHGASPFPSSPSTRASSPACRLFGLSSFPVGAEVILGQPEPCWLHPGGSRSVAAMLRVRRSPRVPGSRLQAHKGGLGLSLRPQASPAPFAGPCCSAHLLLALSTPFSPASPRRPSPCEGSGRAAGQRRSRAWARTGAGGAPSGGHDAFFAFAAPLSVARRPVRPPRAQPCP